VNVVLALFSLASAAAVAFALLAVGRWIAGFPFGERSFRDAYRARPGAPRQRVGLAFARALGGIVGWYLAGSLLVGCSFLAGGETRIDEESMRVQVAPGGPAERAGIKTGDRVVALDGQDIHDWDTLKRAVAAHQSETVHVVVERGGEKLTVEATPEAGKIRVGPLSEQAPVGLGRAVMVGAITPGKLLVSTAHSLVRIFTATEKPELSGPVGIVQSTADTERQGFVAAFKLVSLLVAYFLSYVIVFSIVIALVSMRRPRSVT
jgi:membrane-associated protease RseP (regulator of RpoE activity)